MLHQITFSDSIIPPAWLRNDSLDPFLEFGEFVFAPRAVGLQDDGQVQMNLTLGHISEQSMEQVVKLFGPFHQVVFISSISTFWEHVMQIVLCLPFHSSPPSDGSDYPT